MRSDSKLKPTIPVIPFRFVGLIALSLFLVMLVSFCCTPIDSAWGKTNIHTKEQQKNRPENQGVESPSEVQEGTPFNGVSVRQLDYSFTDENSGATIFHNSDAASDSGEYAAPDIQALNVERGEAALHAEGTCAACDELRVKFRTGEIDALYRVSIAPDIATDDEFTLSVPLDREMQSYAVSRCAGNELDITYSPKFAGSNASSKTHSTASIRGNLGDLQSPFGIAYDATRSDESSTVQSNSSDVGSTGNSRLPPAQTPDNDGGDDDDEDDDPKPYWLWSIIGFAILTLLVAAYFIPSSSKR